MLQVGLELDRVCFHVGRGGVGVGTLAPVLLLAVDGVCGSCC